MAAVSPGLPGLQGHVEGGGQGRLLPTTYTNSTQLEALTALEQAGVQVRVSYDTTTTRLHAKSWLFHRARGRATAYVGSSNLTHSAMVPGLEWNVRVSGIRNPEVIGRMAAVFETYWEGGDFVPFDPPGTAVTRQIRLTNIRVNASQLGVPAVSQAAVQLFISTSASGVQNPIAVPIPNPTPTVATAQPALGLFDRRGRERDRHAKRIPEETRTSRLSYARGVRQRPASRTVRNCALTLLLAGGATVFSCQVRQLEMVVHLGRCAMKVGFACHR